MCNRYNYLGSASISIILGIIIGALFYFGFLPNIQTILMITLVFAVINYVLYTILFLRRNRNGNNSCRCKYSYGIIIGMIGTILFSIFSFGLTLTEGVTITAILISVLAFFLIFMIINIFLFFMCLNEDCRCDCNCSCNCGNNKNSCNTRNNNDFNFNYTNLNNY